MEQLLFEIQGTYPFQAGLQRITVPMIKKWRSANVISVFLRSLKSMEYPVGRKKCCGNDWRFCLWLRENIYNPLSCCLVLVQERYIISITHPGRKQKVDAIQNGKSQMVEANQSRQQVEGIQNKQSKTRSAPTACTDANTNAMTDEPWISSFCNPISWFVKTLSGQIADAWPIISSW